MKAPNNTRRQRTVKIGGRKIVVVSRRKTSRANHVGWNVDIGGVRYFKCVLTREEAEDRALATWIKDRAVSR